jgi:hypothetical protein
LWSRAELRETPDHSDGERETGEDPEGAVSSWRARFLGRARGRKRRWGSGGQRRRFFDWAVDVGWIRRRHDVSAPAFRHGAAALPAGVLPVDQKDATARGAGHAKQHRQSLGTSGGQARAGATGRRRAAGENRHPGNELMSKSTHSGKRCPIFGRVSCVRIMSTVELSACEAPRLLQSSRGAGPPNLDTSRSRPGSPAFGTAGLRPRQNAAPGVVRLSAVVVETVP